MASISEKENFVDKTNNSRRDFIKTFGKIGASSAFVLGAPAVSAASRSPLLSGEGNPAKSVVKKVTQC